MKATNISNELSKVNKIAIKMNDILNNIDFIDEEFNLSENKEFKRAKMKLDKLRRKQVQKIHRLQRQVEYKNKKLKQANAKFSAMLMEV